MRPTQTIDEARKYLFYVSDALNGVASSYSVGRRERQILEKYASEILEYSKNLDQLKIHLTAQEQEQRKLQVVAELEFTYDKQKRATTKARENVRIIKAKLKQAEEKGIKKEIDEIKQRLAYYAKYYEIALQNENIAKHAFEQGA